MTTTEFTCTDCGVPTYKFGDHDSVSVCATCHRRTTMTERQTTAEFICTDCGVPTYKFGSHDGVPVCATCRYIRERPDMPEDAKRLLRGLLNKQMPATHGG
jgi:uncharacterized Zn finger protein (UPF0148 family)